MNEEFASAFRVLIHDVIIRLICLLLRNVLINRWSSTVEILSRGHQNPSSRKSDSRHDPLVANSRYSPDILHVHKDISLCNISSGSTRIVDSIRDRLTIF